MGYVYGGAVQWNLFVVYSWKGFYKYYLEMDTLCGCILCGMIFMNTFWGVEVEIINNLLKRDNGFTNNDLIYGGKSMGSEEGKVFP